MYCTIVKRLYICRAITHQQLNINIMTTQTNHRTFNKTLRREVSAMLPNAATFEKRTLMYSPVYLIKDANGLIVARVEKSKERFGCLAIKVK